MSDVILNKLTRWIRDQVVTEKATGRLIRLDLRHLPVGAKQGSELDTIVPPDSPGSSWYETQAAKLLDTAASDAEGIASGAQRYVVQAYRSKEPDRCVARHAFLVAARDIEDSEGFDSEPPTKQGLTAQLMRHLEAKERVHATSMATIMGHMARITASVTAENEQMRAAHLETFQIVEELLSQRDIRALNAKREEAHIDAIKGALPTLKNIGAAVVHKLGSGANGAHVMGDGRGALIDSLMESMSEDEKARFLELGASLSPDKQMLLAQVLGAPKEH